jgi:acetyl-CoA C-acetyltransferase
MDPWLVEHKPELYMAMIDTADVVAKRYGITREDQDAFSLQSQQRGGGPGRRSVQGRDHACSTRMMEKNKETGEVTYRDVVATRTTATAPAPRWRAWPSWSL